MDYAAVIRDAWRLTWRNRFLWILGLFAGGAVGGWTSPSMGLRFNPSDVNSDYASIAPAFAELGAWLSAHAGMVIGAGVVLVVVSLAWLCLSVISQGAMARATADLARGEPTSLGRAWGVGLSLFWRYLGLWLLMLGAVIALACAGIGIFFLVSFGVSGFEERPRVVVAILTLLLMVPFAVALGIAANIVIAYAERAIALQNVGPLAALRTGAGLLRHHFGDSLITWVLGLAVGFGLAIGVGILVATLILVLGGPGVILAVAAGFTAPTIVYAVLASLVLAFVGFLIVGVVNTFFWNYWTLVYLRLTAPGGAA